MVCVFFFKQKTAYEMRISDWSSDVFSSDLRYGCLGYRRRASYPHPRLAHTGGQQLTRDRQTVRYHCLDRDCGHEFSAGPGPVVSQARHEIPGGASSPGACPACGGLYVGRLCWHALMRSEEHTSELQSLMRISYAVFCLNKKNKTTH